MTASLFYGYWEFWEPYNPSYDIGPNAPAFGNQKVVFDGVNKLIRVVSGVTSLDVQIDIYGNWKEWMLVRENSKYSQALTAVGGDPITGTTAVGITYFLENGWRIKMWEGSHLLSVAGNIYTREPGQDPYVEPDGLFKVTISTVRSNLVDLVTIEGASSNTNISTGDIKSIANNVWDKPLDEIVSTNTTGDKLKKNLTKTQFLSLDE